MSVKEMKPNVLVVDDEKDMCTMLNKFLASKGFEVSCGAP